jgi:hypothetical protein
MENISQEHSIAPNIPFINDTSIAMQWFASEVGCEIHNVLKNWYEERLADICNRLKNLGYC